MDVSYYIESYEIIYSRLTRCLIKQAPLKYAVVIKISQAEIDLSRNYLSNLGRMLSY